jgi:acyl CoA:acetate/3-ketoacid CoA transferase
MTRKGHELSLTEDGTIEIQEEGEAKKHVDCIFETTFNGDEVVRRGITVLYFTEHDVFCRTTKYDALEFIGIAPGMDL